MTKALKKIKRLLTAAVFLGCIILSSNVESAENQNVSGLQGISFPLPLKISAMIPVGRRLSPKLVGRIDVKLYLSTEGTVDSIGWDLAEKDTLVYYPYRDSILSCKFTPAKLAGRKTRFALVCRLEVTSRSVRGGARLLAPFDSSARMEGYQLLLATAKSNDFRYPKIREFPGYFYSQGVDSAERSLTGDFAIVDISLDEKGTALDRTLACASRTTIGADALISSGWAEYEPAKIGENAMKSVARLIVRYFSELDYPIDKVEENAGTLGSNGRMHDSRLIWTIPGQKHYFDPVLRTKTDLLIMTPRGMIQGDYPITAFILIGKDGSSQTLSVSDATTRIVSKFVRERISGLEFYPACVFPAGMKSESEIRLLETFAKVTLIPADSSSFKFEFQFWQNDTQRAER